MVMARVDAQSGRATISSPGSGRRASSRVAPDRRPTRSTAQTPAVPASSASPHRARLSMPPSCDAGQSARMRLLLASCSTSAMPRASITGGT
jgi:hypothetical protein